MASSTNTTVYAESHMHTFTHVGHNGRPRTWNHWQNHVWSRINIIRWRYILEATSRTHTQKSISSGWCFKDRHTGAGEKVTVTYKSGKTFLFSLSLSSFRVSLVGVWWHFPERFGCNKYLLSSMGFRFFVMYGRRPSYSMSHSCYFV